MTKRKRRRIKKALLHFTYVPRGSAHLLEPRGSQGSGSFPGLLGRSSTAIAGVTCPSLLASSPVGREWDR